MGNICTPKCKYQSEKELFPEKRILTSETLSDHSQMSMRKCIEDCSITDWDVDTSKLEQKSYNLSKKIYKLKFENNFDVSILFAYCDPSLETLPDKYEGFVTFVDVYGRIWQAFVTHEERVVKPDNELDYYER